MLIAKPKVIVTVTFSLLIMKISAQKDIVASSKFKILSIVSDLPKKSDLIPYLRALDKIINYMNKNKLYIDVNFTFGLFLVNVNLKNIIKFKRKLISTRFFNKLNETVKKTDALLHYFETTAARDKDPANAKNKLIYSLFSNQSMWVEQIRKFNIWKQMQMPSPQQIKDKFTKWNAYMKNVENAVPMTKSDNSDKCMMSLARNPVNHVSTMTKCKLSDSCYDISINGSDFGYTLSHRLLLLLIARYGRGCIIFTPFLDRELTRRFCTASYGEAEFIAMQHFVLPDLLLEKISLCGLDGHTQFIRRSWMKGVLQFQSKDGCFGKPTSRNKRETDKIENHDVKHHTGRIANEELEYKELRGGAGRTKPTVNKKAIQPNKKASSQKEKSKRKLQKEPNATMSTYEKKTIKKGSKRKGLSSTVRNFDTTTVNPNKRDDSFFGITEDESLTLPTTPKPTWSLTRPRDFEIGPNCTTHLTAVAASALATAIKFLLMSFY